MHREAFEWVSRYANDDPLALLSVGGRDVNGTCDALFPNASITVLDILPGPNVDIVADAATWQPDRAYDLVLATEVFEHTASWPQICATAYKALRPGGRLILTMAGPGRPPHSGIDGGWFVYPGEHYANVDPDELREVLVECGFAPVTVEYRPSPADTRAVAMRPE